jgi:hypothetical protein
MKDLRTQLLATALCGVTAFGLAHKAFAGTDLVQNGNFATTTPQGPTGELGVNITVADWTGGGYTFLFTPGTADTTGATDYGGSNVQLWGQHNSLSYGYGPPSANGLPSAGETGGNFLASDGSFFVVPIQQTINNLTAGDTYAVSFYWAAAQEFGETGATTEQWQVSLGGIPQSTSVYDNTSHGSSGNSPSADASGWMNQTFNFTAPGTPGSTVSEVLSFLSVGTPDGIPPFSLLSDVSMEAVPEPSTAVLFGFAAAVVGFAARRCHRQCRQ